MKTASVGEMENQFSEYLKSSASTPVVVTQNGRAVAVLLGVQDDDEIERLLMAHSPKLRSILKRSRRQFREGKWLEEEDFWSRVAATPKLSVTKPKKRKT